MKNILDSFVPKDLFGIKYEDYNEYILDVLKQAEYMVLRYIECLDPRSNVINNTEANQNINLKSTFNENRDAVFQDMVRIKLHIKSRMRENVEEGMSLSLEYVKYIFRLTDIEFFCLLLSMLGKFDDKYGKIFASLQGSPELVSPSLDLMIKIYYFVDDISEISDYHRIKQIVYEKMDSLCFDQGTTEISQRLFSFIWTNGAEPLRINGVESITEQNVAPLKVNEELAAQLKDLITNYDEDETMYVCLYGPNGIGRKTQVKRCAQLFKIPLTIVDLSQVDTRDGKVFYSSVLTACREVLLTQGMLLFTNIDVLMNVENNEGIKAVEMILNVCEKFTNVVFISSNDPIRNTNIVSSYNWMNIEVTYPTKDESIEMWSDCLQNVNLKEKIEPYELANKFTFTPAQIVGTQRDAQNLFRWNRNTALTKKQLYNCAYNQVISDLDQKSTLIYAKYNWDQLILADEEKEMLKNACDQIRYKHIVYDKWGFNKRLSYGRGVSMLFAGPPGTGKTMAAQVVGNDLNIEIYKVDLSQIVSKYIGETEKNLNELFKEAKKSNVILFFDETDALLGKRTEVKDSHDKNANLETSYLLQKMEEYDGITIMTTNYLENIDSAFFRRITYVIHFPFPDVLSRKKIWQTMFPKELPLDKNIDFDYLANQFEISGGNIKNVAVTAAFLAAKTGKKLKMDHILKAIKYELTKQGKTLLKEDFGEHGYLL